MPGTGYAPVACEDAFDEGGAVVCEYMLEIMLEANVRSQDRCSCEVRAGDDLRVHLGPKARNSPLTLARRTLPSSTPSTSTSILSLSWKLEAGLSSFKRYSESDIFGGELERAL